MRLLLDTHALLWYVDQDHLLSATAHASITNPTNELLLSAASIWELAIKAGLGKLTLSLPYRQWMSQAMADLDLAVLPITIEYADVQAGLPNHHRDPFDRLLIAQAQVENVPVLSNEDVFDRYGVSRLW
ncbi:MAG: type II toxin-antitoxin system VapC family toxin [Pirellulales bacterium]